MYSPRLWEVIEIGECSIVVTHLSHIPRTRLVLPHANRKFIDEYSHMSYEAYIYIGLEYSQLILYIHLRLWLYILMIKCLTG